MLGGMDERDEFVEPATPQLVIDEEDPSRGPKPGHWSEDGPADAPRS